MNFFSKTKLIIFSIIVVVIYTLCLFVSVAYANEIELKTAQQNEILQTISMEQSRLDELSNQYTEAVIEQGQLEAELKETKIKIKKTKKEIKNNQKQLEKQMISTYKNGETSMLDVLLDASSFESFVTNIDFCSRYVESTQKLLAEKESLEETLKQQKISQEQTLQQLDSVIQEIENSKTEANMTITNLQSQYEQLDEEIAVLVLQNQLTSNQPVEEENYDNYINENVVEILSGGNASAEIYQADVEEVKEKIEAGESIDNYDSDVVTRAYAMLGSPYVWGGTTSDGFDCSGFVSYCLTGEEGTRLGTTETFVGWTQVSDPQPGDVCVVHNGSSQHTGIYVGDGNMVHASTYGVGVIEGPVQDGMIYVRYE